MIDHLKTPWRLDVCRLVAAWGALPFGPKALDRGGQRRAFLSDPTQKQGFHCTPQHGSWLNHVEWWLSVLARRLRQRGDCCAPEDCATRLVASLAVYNTPQAHP